jgi:8-oxo-dGTP pyrophosphatase MutT (NUDIX family)
MARFDLQWIQQLLAQHQPTVIDSDTVSRRAAVSIILRSTPSPNDWELLFIHRTIKVEDPWSGHMAFPGGRLDASDLSALHAARRETREEVGLDLEAEGELLGQLDDVYASARGRILPLAVSPFVFLMTGIARVQCDGQEVDEALWVPVHLLLDPASASSVPYEHEGQRFDLPCFKTFGRIIWGLTYQMLMRFFTVLGWEVGKPGS